MFETFGRVLLLENRLVSSNCGLTAFFNACWFDLTKVLLAEEAFRPVPLLPHVLTLHRHRFTTLTPPERPNELPQLVNRILWLYNLLSKLKSLTNPKRSCMIIVTLVK